MHVHVLPGIDDGVRTDDEAVALAADAAEAGVRVLAATPHLRPDHPRVKPEELRRRVSELRALLASRGVGIDVVQGGEVDLRWAIDASDDDLREASYGRRGTDLLVETPNGYLPPMFEGFLFRLGSRGYRVLLAHPERSPAFQSNPDRLRALVETGTLLQVTASSLLRPRHSRTGQLARALVAEGAAHVIASDSHGPRFNRAGLADGVLAATRLAPRRAVWMATEVPEAILAGDSLPPAPPEAYLGSLRRRLWPARGSLRTP